MFRRGDQQLPEVRFSSRQTLFESTLGFWRGVDVHRQHACRCRGVSVANVR